jgi:hypothetical protein
MAVIFLTLTVALWSSERFWEDTEYCSEAIVLFGCLGEFLTEYEHVLRGDDNRAKRHRLGRAFAIILMVGIATELLALARTNELFSETIAALNKEAGDARRDAGNATLQSEQLRKENLSLQGDVLKVRGEIKEAQSQLFSTRVQVTRQDLRAHLLPTDIEHWNSLAAPLFKFGGTMALIAGPSQCMDNEMTSLVSATALFLVVGAQWHIWPNHSSAEIGCGSGLFVMVDTKASQRTKDAAKALLEFFKSRALVPVMSTVADRPSSLTIPYPDVVIVIVESHP